MHVAGGVIDREAELFEVVDVPLDLRSVGDVKPEPGEDLDDVVHGERYRVAVPELLRAAGQRDVELLPTEVRVQRSLGDRLLRSLEKILDAGLDRVDRLADARPLVGRELAHAAQHGGERALLAVGQAPQDIGLVERSLTVPGQIDQRAKAGFFRQLNQRQTRQTQSRR